MEVREVMTRNVISVSPDMRVGEAADLLLRHRIHGAPVVDESEQLVGMVTFVDLATRRGATVRDIMTVDPVWAPEDAPIEEVAAMMLDRKVRGVPIVGETRVVGVVSAGDIIEMFLNLHEESERPRERPGIRRTTLSTCSSTYASETGQTPDPGSVGEPIRGGAFDPYA